MEKRIRWNLTCPRACGGWRVEFLAVETLSGPNPSFCRAVKIIYNPDESEKYCKWHKTITFLSYCFEQSTPSFWSICPQHCYPQVIGSPALHLLSQPPQQWTTPIWADTGLLTEEQPAVLRAFIFTRLCIISCQKVVIMVSTLRYESTD